MNRAEIYRRAARLCDSAKGMGMEPRKWFSCNAIDMAEGRINSDSRSAFTKLFASHVFDGQAWLSTMKAQEEWGKKGRVIALCFASAMAKTGDI